MLEETFESIRAQMLQYLEAREGDACISIEDYEEGVTAVNSCIDDLNNLLRNIDKIHLPENELAEEFPELIHAMDMIDRYRAIIKNMDTLVGLMIPVIQLLFIIKKAAKVNSH